MKGPKGRAMGLHKGGHPLGDGEGIKTHLSIKLLGATVLDEPIR